MSDGFMKLPNGLLTSSLWSKDDKTRLMWVTMMVTADSNGLVTGTIPEIATIAKLSLKDTEDGIKTLCSPDKYAQSKQHGGRRLIKTVSGWQIINYKGGAL